MRNILSLCLIFAISTLNAQSKDVLAKASYLKAQELYGNAEYEQAAAKLEEAATYLGSTNPRIEYLKVQCYYETKNVEKAQQALATYFKLAAEDDPNYMQMLTRVEDVKAIADQMAKSIRIEYNLKVGQSFEIESKTVTQLPDGLTSTILSTSRYSVLAVRGNDYQMKCEIVQITFPTGIPSILSTSFSGKSFQYTMNKTGTASNLQGVADMMSEVASTVENTKMKSAERGMVKLFLVALEGTDIWKESLEALTPHTNEAIYPGKEWVKKEWINFAEYKEQLEVTYRLESISGNVANISFRSALAPGTMYGGSELAGNQTGTLDIDVSSGFLLNGSETKKAETKSNAAPAQPTAMVMMMERQVAKATPAINFSSTTTYRRN